MLSLSCWTGLECQTGIAYTAVAYVTLDAVDTTFQAAKLGQLHPRSLSKSKTDQLLDSVSRNQTHATAKLRSCNCFFGDLPRKNHTSLSLATINSRCFG